MKMDEKYGDGSDHECCPKCGFCKTCGDCDKYGCGAPLLDIYEKVICPECCWYDDNDQHCNKGKEYNDEDGLAYAVECSGFVKVESDGTD